VAFPPGEEAGSIEEFLARARDRLKALPGVERVARSVVSPFGTAMGGGVRVPGEPPPKRGDPIWTYYNQVTPDFFEALGMRVTRGRTFTHAEEGREESAAVISAAIARSKWGDGNAIGKCFRMGGDSTSACIEVVGIVEDAHQFKLVRDSMMLFYLPLSAKPGRARLLFVRTAGPADRMIAPVRRALQSLSPIIPWPRVETMQSRVEPLLWQWKLGAWMLPLFGSLALIVACVGLYSVLAYSVTQRAAELAIRSALGAGATRLLRLVLADGARMVAIGLALGIIATLAAGRVLSGLLLGTSPVDGATFIMAALVLAAASVAASLIPAWRATKADPVKVLRTD
jgi:putative ABC transport system permease protein